MQSPEDHIQGCLPSTRPRSLPSAASPGAPAPPRFLLAPRRLRPARRAARQHRLLQMRALALACDQGGLCRKIFLTKPRQGGDNLVRAFPVAPETSRTASTPPSLTTRWPGGMRSILLTSIQTELPEETLNGAAGAAGLAHALAVASTTQSTRSAASLLGRAANALALHRVLALPNAGGMRTVTGSRPGRDEAPAHRAWSRERAKRLPPPGGQAG